MATTSISSNIGDVSSYSSRMVTITVTGIHQQSARLANQTISVSYSRLSQTLRNIHRSGGKIVNVFMHSAGRETIKSSPSNSAVSISETLVDAPVATGKIEEVVQHQPETPTVPVRSGQHSHSHGSKKKKR